MVSLCSSDNTSLWVLSGLESMVVNTLVASRNSLALFLFAVGSLMNEITASSKLSAVSGSFPFEELFKLQKAGPECKDSSDTEDDEEDDDDDVPKEDDDVPEEEDDAADEDFSGGEEGEDADPEDEPEANGDGGSDDEEEEDEDGDDDGDNDDDEDAEEEEEEVPQPPAQRRK